MSKLATRMALIVSLTLGSTSAHAQDHGRGRARIVSGAIFLTLGVIANVAGTAIMAYDFSNSSGQGDECHCGMLGAIVGTPLFLLGAVGASVGAPLLSFGLSESRESRVTASLINVRF